MAIVQQKINCKSCLAGKCQDCINPDCLCRESHNKPESLKDGVRVVEEQRTSPETWKKIYHDQEEATSEHKRVKNNNVDHLDYSYDVLSNIHIKAMEDTQELYYYENGVHKPNAKVRIKKELLKINPRLKKHEVDEIIEKIKQLTWVSRDDFDKDEYKICLKNCIIDFRTGKTEEHDPEKLFLIQIPVTYEPKSKCPKFIKFMHTCLPLPDDYIMALEQMACPIIKNTPKLEAMYFHTGSGDNGKSTYFAFMNWMYGKENYSTVSFHDLVSNRFAKARLENKLLNTFPDIESTTIDNLDMIKGVISGDDIDAEYKYQNPHTFANRSKLFFAANELPDIKAKTFSNFKRLRLIKWTQQFLKPDAYYTQFNKLKEKNPELSDEEIKSELGRSGIHLMNRKFINSIIENEDEKSGIFNLLLICVRKIYERDGFFIERDLEELKEHWSENSTALERFVNECIRKDPDGYIAKGECHSIYANLCRTRGKVPLPANVFHPQLHDKVDGLEEGWKKNTRVWKGISWNTNHGIVRRYLNTTGTTGKSDNLSPQNATLDNIGDGR